MHAITMSVLVVVMLVSSSTGQPPLPSHSIPVKILPLGDSITFGCGDSCRVNCNISWVGLCSVCSGGWRTYLWRSLQNSTLFNSTGFQFVGTQRNGPEDIDTRHDGYPGFTIPEIGLMSNKWVSVQPDIILLAAGTNDMGFLLPPHFGASGAQTAKRMTKFLENTFEALPQTHIMLASLIGSINVYGGHSHQEFNELLPGIVADFTSRGFAITFVDMFKETGGDFCKGWPSENCCPAGVHPSPAGYQKMASVWFNALNTSFGVTAASVSTRKGREHRIFI